MNQQHLWLLDCGGGKDVWKFQCDGDQRFRDEGGACSDGGLGHQYRQCQYDQNGGWRTLSSTKRGIYDDTGFLVAKNALEVGGVTVAGIVPDQTDFPVSYQPGHPHADQDGFVRLPNIQLPNEMIDMITASRSYEANLKSITLFKEMVEQSLSLLNGGQ